MLEELLGLPVVVARLGKGVMGYGESGVVGEFSPLPVSRCEEKGSWVWVVGLIGVGSALLDMMAEIWS
jgi:hypothetical protein